VIKFFHSERIADSVNFLKSLPIFEEWNKESLKMVAQNMAMKKFNIGDTIIKEGIFNYIKTKNAIY
jgi:signal-transduction protein with cAMP-binding, CBS, and nucleotidyltransferase domain